MLGSDKSQDILSKLKLFFSSYLRPAMGIGVIATIIGTFVVPWLFPDKNEILIIGYKVDLIWVDVSVFYMFVVLGLFFIVILKSAKKSEAKRLKLNDAIIGLVIFTIIYWSLLSLGYYLNYYVHFNFSKIDSQR